jgi:uncharacterized protein YndB with AHSA1/START domain
MERMETTTLGACAVSALLVAGLGGFASSRTSPQESEPPADPITSEVRRTESGERILVQEVLVEAPVSAVWAAYTTAEGWTAWAAPKAEVDLRVGGTIRTAYGDVEVGEDGTNTLHILNYVPEVLLTLRADVGENWPDVLKQDADKLSNVILFDAVSEERTRIRSFGIGYGDSPEYESLMQFFISANEGLFAELKDYLENGEPRRWGD